VHKVEMKMHLYGCHDDSCNSGSLYLFMLSNRKTCVPLL